MEISPWNYLSFEIVEKILLDVPTADMVYNKPWVYKTWTNVLLQPSFWIRKLKNIGITVEEEIKSVLTGFERNIQVACLYHTCLNEEHDIMKIENDEFNFLNECPVDFDCGLLLVSDDFTEMLKVAGSLITRSAISIELNLEKKVVPVLPLLLKLLAVRKSKVILHDYYSFWNFSPRNLQFLKGSNRQANLKSLIGCVSTLDGLKKNANDLKVSIAINENNIAIDPGFKNTKHRISTVYIKAGSDVSRVAGLTSNFFTLVVTGLEPTHVIWMKDLANTFLQFDGPHKLILLNYKLNKTTSEELLRSMTENSFIPPTILCASSTLNADDALYLNDLAAKLYTNMNIELSNRLKKNWFVCYERDEELTESEVWLNESCGGPAMVMVSKTSHLCFNK